MTHSINQLLYSAYVEWGGKKMAEEALGFLACLGVMAIVAFGTAVIA